MLDSVLGKLARQHDPNVLVGFDTADDAGVYQLTPELALVQTADFFTPIVDDPYVFGQIAATNALSDVYAMGGQPLSALALVCFTAKQSDLAEHAQDPEVRRRAGLLLDTLTPIAKTFPAEWGFEANVLSLQIHGGYGFTLEYDIQLYYRRAEAWPLAIGDPRRGVAELADALFGPVEVR